MKVLMTGANGFLGAKLARKLADSGVQVRAIVRRPDAHPELKHAQIELVAGDFGDPAILKTALVGIDQVYHLAAIATDWAKDLREFYKINVESALRLVELSIAAGVSKMVITSTAGTIGPPDPDHVVPVTEDHIRRVKFFTDYETSKMILEERLQEFVKKGAHIVIVNPTRVFGPGPIERKNGYLLLIRSYLFRVVAPYPAFKTQIGNLAFVDDVVDGHILAMEKGRSGERYLLGGNNVVFEDLFQTLTKITGKRGRPLPIPLWLFRLFATINRWQAKWFGQTPFLTHDWIYKSTFSWPVSSQKAVTELGYRIHDFEAALRKTVEFVEAEVKAGRA